MIEVSNIEMPHLPCSSCGVLFKKTLKLPFKEIMIKSGHGFAYMVLCSRCRIELIKQLNKE